MAKIGSNTEIDRILNEKFTSKVRTGYVEVGGDKICLSINYVDYETTIREFKVRNEDVFITGVPKSGTTWCHEMVWVIVNDFNYEGAKKPNFIRCPLLDFPALYDTNLLKFDGLPPDFKMEIYLENLVGRRTIKTHLPWSLLPKEIRNETKQPKIINIFRNPKDACVSHYHQSRFTGGFRGSFEEFTELYLNGRVPYGPFWKQVLSFWGQKHRPNILYITYTEMKTDLRGIIKKVAKFLDKAISEAQIAELEKYLSFSSMTDNPSVNLKDRYEKWAIKNDLMIAEGEILRRGQIGNFNDFMSPQMSRKFDQWSRENLTGSDFLF